MLQCVNTLIINVCQQDIITVMQIWYILQQGGEQAMLALAAVLVIHKQLLGLLWSP